MAVDALFSYAFHRTTDLALCKKALGPDQFLMIDSGAFTVFTSGKEIKLADYIAYLKHWQGAYDYAISLDVIGNPKATAKNLLALENAGLPVLPVYTSTAKLQELRALAKDHDYIAFGGTVKMPAKIRDPATQVVIREAKQLGAKVHALGNTTKQAFRSGAHSGDSSSNSTVYAFGAISLYDPFSRRKINFSMRNKSNWVKYSRLFEMYGVPARLWHTGDNGAAVIVHRACVLSTAVEAAHLNKGGPSPRLYSALGQPRATEGAKLAAIDWKTANLPSPLKQIAEKATSRHQLLSANE